MDTKVLDSVVAETKAQTSNSIYFRKIRVYIAILFVKGFETVFMKTQTLHKKHVSYIYLSTKFLLLCYMSLKFA